MSVTRLCTCITCDPLSHATLQFGYGIALGLKQRRHAVEAAAKAVVQEGKQGSHTRPLALLDEVYRCALKAAAKAVVQEGKHCHPASRCVCHLARSTACAAAVVR